MIKQLCTVLSYDNLSWRQVLKRQICKPLITDSISDNARRTLHDGNVMHSSRETVEQYSQCHRKTTTFLYSKNMSSSMAFVVRLCVYVAYDSSYVNEFGVCWMEWWHHECLPVNRKVSPFTRPQLNLSPMLMHDVEKNLYAINIG